MVKLTFCVRRLPHLSREAALRQSRGAPEPFDGVAELWFESAEDLQAAARTPEGRAAGATLLEDERRFIDLTHSPLCLGHEHDIV